jgi:hypothetical protein
MFVGIEYAICQIPILISIIFNCLVYLVFVVIMIIIIVFLFFSDYEALCMKFYLFYFDEINYYMSYDIDYQFDEVCWFQHFFFDYNFIVFF